MRNKRNLKKNLRQQKVVTPFQLRICYFCLRRVLSSEVYCTWAFFSILYVDKEGCYMFKYLKYGIVPYSDTTGARLACANHVAS